MAREKDVDPRFDWREGINVSDSPEVVGPRQLRYTTNARAIGASVVQRNGSRVIHDNSLGGTILGMFQWDAPGGKQVVAITAAGFHHKLPGATDFTTVASVWDATKEVAFLPHRVGATIILYIGNGVLRRWDGAALTTVAGAPSATALRLYQGRIYAGDDTKRLYGSAIQDGANWASADGGIFADVETYDSEGIMGLALVGSSLAIAKEDNIARLTGTDRNDIQIDKQTRGISNEQGLLARKALLELSGSIFGISDRGPFVASEQNIDDTLAAGARAVFESATGAQRAAAIAAHHATRKEVWIWIAGNVWAWHYPSRAWFGPWTGSIALADAVCRYERADGTETLLRGIGGYVIEEDVEGATTDNQSRLGAGGNDFSLGMTFAGMTFGDPDRKKKLSGDQLVSATVPPAGTLTLVWESEMGSGSCTVGGLAGGQRTRRFKFTRAKGAQFFFTIQATGGATINGFVPRVAHSRGGR